LRKHVDALSVNLRSRQHTDTARLNQVADYILSYLRTYCDTAFFQNYSVEGREYRNVIGIKRGLSAKTTVIGARYDVCGNFAGADDNASGVAGLLETARLTKSTKLKNTLELVAYTLEEPPYFRTKYMGSYVHAQSLKPRGIEVDGMVCLEMIGYFSNERKSQSYPLKILSLFYGNRGDFISLVNQVKKGQFSDQFMSTYKKYAHIKTKKFIGPKSLQGIDFSDHLNYWNLGISAVMITDTSFFRNKNYHTINDTAEKLNYTKMGLVIEGLFLTLFQN
jgi:Zn-dependent M28 family amino/carboxypeptidase